MGSSVDAHACPGPRARNRTEENVERLSDEYRRERR